LIGHVAFYHFDFLDELGWNLVDLGGAITLRGTPSDRSRSADAVEHHGV
jgi:hypothetical protein